MADKAPALVHASCVALGERGVLLVGASGAGKSDLALRLIDRGATLVSDDYTLVARSGSSLTGSAPATIAGLIEVRGIGLVTLPHLPQVRLALVADLDSRPARLPEPATRLVGGIALPLIALAALESSAPIKLELALAALAGSAP
jgi:serine kinase of HPr protein (carbohydrate metabolism regulator)